MKFGKLVLTILAWTWFVIGGMFAVVAFGDGKTISGLLIALSALFALPPLWQKLADTKFNLALSHRFAGGIIAFFVGMTIHMNATSSQSQVQEQAEVDAANAERLNNRAEPASQTEDIPDNLASALKDLESKIADHAVIVMDGNDYPQLLSRIGEEAFSRANTLSPWAAIAAVTVDECASTVDLVAVSDKASADNLHWFVDCQNGKRIEVTELEATTAKQIWTDPEGVLAQQASAKVEQRAGEPTGSVVDDLDTADEAVIVGSCDRAVTATLTSQSSYDPSWSYDYRKDRTSGRVEVTRDFEAQNGFGGTLSSRYECVVDGRTKGLVSLRIREGSSWKTLYSK